MNLVADPILTPSKDEKDANRCQRTTRKREETVLIESRIEIRNEGGRLSIGRVMGWQKRYYVHIP